MTETLEYTGRLTITHCGVCSIRFAMPDDLMTRCRERGDGFWCPSGHRLVFITTEAEKLRRELAREVDRTKSARDDANRYRIQRIRVEHQLRSVKGHQTRLKKRISAGVCPCCTRTFQNVARHMESQHPDYVASTPAEGPTCA
jgi:hypothetical protein